MKDIITWSTNIAACGALNVYLCSTTNCPATKLQTGNVLLGSNPTTEDNNGLVNPILTSKRNENYAFSFVIMATTFGDTYST